MPQLRDNADRVLDYCNLPKARRIRLLVNISADEQNKSEFFSSILTIYTHEQLPVLRTLEGGA